MKRLFGLRPKDKASRTFILPTGFGYAFAGVALVLLMMAMGYANNLIYLFVFSLISLAMSGTWLTNQNVDRIKIRKINEPLLFAKEENAIEVSLVNPSKAVVYHLELLFGKKNPATKILKILPGEQREVIAKWKPTSRGEHILPVLQLRGKFPFDLLQAWRTFREPALQKIYPQRRGDFSWPKAALAAQGQDSQGLFRDHRIFQSTDSPRRIDWRASARHQELLVKNFESQPLENLAFDWSQTEHLPHFEDRLSQLSLWLSRAEEAGLNYSLRVGNFHSGLSKGSSHLRKCLDPLATALPEQFL